MKIKFKAKVLKKFKSILIFSLVMVLCITTQLFAVNTEDDEQSISQDEILPHIEMRVKVNIAKDSDGEGSNQVLVEAWATNITNLVGLEIIFTYDSTIIQPSYISGDSKNEELYGLDSIKPSSQADSLSKEEQNKLNAQSREVLSNSFEFSENYKDILGIDVFKYYEVNGDIESLQFGLSRKDYLREVDETNEILIGTFSFKQTDETTVEDGLFSTQRIKVECDENLKSDEEDSTTYYIRDITKNPEDNCEEIVVFVYERYGSISGTIDASIGETDANKYGSKNIATIKVYKAETVETVNWALAGTPYINVRDSLPKPEIEYTTTEENNGNFKIDNIKFGRYVVLVDKDYWGDFIITDVVIDSENKNINFSEIETIGTIELIPGDINKDGVINSTDTLEYNKDLNSVRLVDFDDVEGRDGKNTSTDTLIYNSSLNLHSDKKIKKVVSLVGGLYEE